MWKGMKPILFMGLALGMIAFAVPRVDIRDLTSPGSLFGLVWIGFALLVVAAHLHELLGVEEEKKHELLQIKRMKRWQQRQLFAGKRRVLQVKKSR